MSDFLDFFKQKKNLVNLLLLGILVLALPLGVNLIRQQQIIKSRAAVAAITFKGSNVEQKNGSMVALKPQISLELTSPLGPPGIPSNTPSPSPSSTPTPSSSPIATLNKKVLLLIYNPVQTNGQKLSVYKGWNDPDALTTAFINSISTVNRNRWLPD